MVIDAGNGTCGFVGDMLERMGCQVEMLFPRMDHLGARSAAARFRSQFVGICG
jgi:hypothetical protein